MVALVSGAELRTRRMTPVPEPAGKTALPRICATEGCDTPLASGKHTRNKGDYCGACEVKRSKAAFAAVRAQAETVETIGERPYRPNTRRRQHMQVGDITLTPTEVPQRRCRGREEWRAVVDAFIRSGEEGVLVEAPGPKTVDQPHSIYESLKHVIRPGEPVRVQTRDGKCYLAREVQGK